MKIFKDIKFKRRVSIITPSLIGGGAEKAAINLANMFHSNNYYVEVICLYKNSSENNLLNKEINVINLECRRISGSILKLRNIFIRTKSTIFISFITANNIAISIAKIFLQKKHYYIYTQHEILSYFLIKNNKELKNFILFFLVKIFYPYADKIICVSKGLENELKSLIKENSSHKIETIYNNIYKRDFVKKRNSKKYIRLLSIGRLIESKDFETLIEGINLIKDQLELRLIIVGEGPQKVYLKNLIKEYKIENICEIKSFTQDIDNYYANADIYISTSLYESFGNTIAEAMMFNLKIISTDCKYGPREILENGLYGELIELKSPKSLAKAIKKLSTSNKRINYEKSLERFSNETILKRYEELTE